MYDICISMYKELYPREIQQEWHVIQTDHIVPINCAFLPFRKTSSL